MTVKFNQYWTINHEKASVYGDFMVKKYIPTLNSLGIHVVAGWTVLVGAYSEIIFEGVSNDLELLEKALRDDNYKSVNHELQNHIRGYKTKVLVSTGKMETYSTTISKNTVKFNQTWDIVNSKKSEYEAYVTEKFYPFLEDMGIHVAGEWEVLIGDGPGIICEGRAKEKDCKTTLIDALRGQDFMNAQHELKKYVYNYQSRILAFHIQKIHGYKAASYELVTG